MAVYVALLRGINVGGNRKVGMPALKSGFETLGFERVETYINSGNVVFESAEAESADTLAGRIEQGIAAACGFPVDVIVRPGEDMGRIVDANPFAAFGTPEAWNLHVGFMRETPASGKLAKLDGFVNENDQYRVAGREIYVTFRAGVRDSKLGVQLGKLGVPVTLRNWNTVTKLRAMADARQT